MLRHGHAHEKPLSDDERAELVSHGSVAQGIVMQNDPSPDDRTRARLRVVARFKDGEQVEFHEELASLYQPVPGSDEARRIAEVRGAGQLRHPDRTPKIQLPLSAGERVPVRFDAANRHHVVLDVPAIRARAVHDYIERERKPRQPAPARAGAAAGPPWVVPTHCPNCGAPVDQARASRDADPMCVFCRQPLPVTPLR